MKVQIHNRVLTWLKKHPDFSHQFHEILKDLKANPHSGPKLGNSDLRKVRINRKYRLLYYFDSQALVLLDIAPSDKVVRQKAYTQKLNKQAQKVNV
jgi:mRNA-degrading endonuclease RelE of RelBE toxin-antitoxin system